MKKQKPARKVTEPTFPKVYETFAEPRDIFISGPTSFNGWVRVVRYRVTVERIDEPEAEADRLRALWRACDNYHQRDPISAAAKPKRCGARAGAFGA